MVARLQIFKLQSQFGISFRGYCNWRCWYILWLFGQFPAIYSIIFGHSKYLWSSCIFVFILYILPRFGMLFQEKSCNPYLLCFFQPIICRQRRDH
jgi:hypothetical protein